jgi:hypothetical protein
MSPVAEVAEAVGELGAEVRDVEVGEPFRGGFRGSLEGLLSSMEGRGASPAVTPAGMAMGLHHQRLGQEGWEPGSGRAPLGGESQVDGLRYPPKIQSLVALACQDLPGESGVAGGGGKLFLALTRVALGGIHDGQALVGETVLVTGLGTVGLLTV